MTPLILAAIFALVATLTMQPVRLVPDAGGDAGGGDAGGGSDSAGEPSGDAGEFDSLTNLADSADSADPAAESPQTAKPQAAKTPSNADVLASVKQQIAAEKAAAQQPDQPVTPAVPKPPAANPQLPPAFALSQADLQGVPKELVGHVQPLVEQMLARAYNERAKPYVESVLKREQEYQQWYQGVSQRLEQPAGQIWQYLEANPQLVAPIIDWINGGGQPAQQQQPADPFAEIDLNSLDPDTARVVQSVRAAHTQSAQEVAALRALVEQQQGQLRVTAEQQAAYEAERTQAEHTAWMQSQESSLKDAFAAARKAFGFSPSDYPKEWGRAVNYMQTVIKATSPDKLGQLNYRELLKDALDHARFDQVAQRRTKQRNTSAPPPETGPTGSGAPLTSEEFNRRALARAKSDAAAGKPLTVY